MEKWIDFKNIGVKHSRILQSMKNMYQGLQNTTKKADLCFCFVTLEKNYFMIIIVFFHYNQLSIGMGWHKPGTS